MTDWAGHSAEEKGRFIRYGLANINIMPNNNNAWNASAVAGIDGIMMLNMTEKPSRDELIAFRTKVRESFREYMDGLLLNFKMAISNEAIQRLAGTALALNNGSASAFLESEGVLLAGRMDATDYGHQSGEARANKVRELKEKAILNPDEYVKDANRDKATIDNKALAVYKESLDLYYRQYQYPMEEAKKLAIDDMRKYKEMLTERHKKLFDASLYEQASKKIYKTGAIV